MRATRRTRRRLGEGHVEYILITSLIMVCALVGLFSMIENVKIVSLEKHLCVECPANLEVDELDKRITHLEDALSQPGLSADERINLQASLDDHLAERASREAAALAASNSSTDDTTTDTDSADADAAAADDYAYNPGIYDSGIWDIISIFSGAPNFWSWMEGMWT
jgi:hypothetical protein